MITFKHVDVFIRQTDGVSDPNSKHGDRRALVEFSAIIFFKITILELEFSCLQSSFYESVKLGSFSINKDAFIHKINHALRPNDRLCSDPTIACVAISYFYTNKISYKAIIISLLSPPIYYYFKYGSPLLQS